MPLPAFSPPRLPPRRRAYRYAVVEIFPTMLGGFLIRFRDRGLHKRACLAMACQDAHTRLETAMKGAYIDKPDNLPPIPHRKRRLLLERHQEISILLDTWAAAHYYGWDAHTAFEGNSRMGDGALT